MRIALLGPVEPYKGGIAHFNTLLFKHLAARHEVELISWRRRFPQLLYPGGDQVEEGKKYLLRKDKRFLLDFLNPFTWLKAFWMIKKKKSDLLIFPWATPALAHVFFVILSLVKCFTPTKVLAICHNVLPHEARPIDKFLTRLVFRKVDCFIVHSQEDLSNLKKIKRGARATLGFHPTYASFQEKTVKRDIKEGFRLGKKVLLFFGFIREYKGLKYLLEALPQVLKEIDCDLLIVGEFWEDKNAYLALIKKLGLEKKVHLVSDYVPDEEVGNYFSAADVLVLPYTSATQSGIVQLAFGLEKPVITTKIGGLPEVVEDNRTGFLVPPRDAQALAEAIIRFYKQKKKTPFIDNIRKEKDKYSWETYLDLIEKTSSFL